MNIAQLIQQHYQSSLATLVIKLGDITLAEDVLQEASIAALNHWQNEIPLSPKAWLIKVASNKAIDILRKANLKPPFEHQPLPLEEGNIDGECLGDDVLKLIFICCHPAINIENQLIMNLKLVMGFNLSDVSRVLFISEKALEQRLTRTKRKIKASKITLDLPSADKLKYRLSSVLHSLYLIFNEGYHSSTGDKLLSRQVCNQSISMLRLLCNQYPSHARCIALLSLMLFTNARSNARSYSSFIALQAHDRTLYDQGEIKEADMLLQRSLKMDDGICSYHIEAAISGLHSQASTFEDTDWQQISLLYNKLLSYQDSPIVELNKAVADMMLKQYSQAEKILNRIEQRLQNYLPLYLAKAKLYTQTHRIHLAIHSYQNALSLPHNTIEKVYIKTKLDELQM